MAATPKDVRAIELDATDRELLRVLQLDARIPNSELAARVGIAASTAHGRVRRLVDAGVIRDSSSTSTRLRWDVRWC